MVKVRSAGNKTGTAHLLKPRSFCDTSLLFLRLAAARPCLAALIASLQEDCIKHASQGSVRGVRSLGAPDSVKVAKEFLGAVDEVNKHLGCGGTGSNLRSS